MTDQPAIEADGLGKQYRGVAVLDSLTLTVPRGTVFCLLGPNGAGKTTTVRILTTLTRADHGRARIDGYDVAHDRAQVRRRISLTGQYAALDGLQTGAENLRMMARLAGHSRAESKARAAELLATFDLTEAGDRRTAEYSGGMRRRLDIAASLVSRPSVVFLDEPTTGLDPRSRRAMWTVVSELADSGVTVFLTTQYLEEADRLAHRVTVLDGGRVVADGSPEQLKSRIDGGRLELTASSPAAYATLLDRLGTRAGAVEPNRLQVGVPTDGSAAHVRTLLDELDPDGDQIASFDLHRATLDDVFLSLTGHRAATTEQASPTEQATAIEKEDVHV
jgi:ABC-2 type transport system ATP-binding protein